MVSENIIDKGITSDYFMDMDNLIYVEKNLNNSYYVGKQESNYTESVSGKYDFALYLELPMFLPQRYGNGCTYEIADTSVAYVNNNELIPLSQGLTELTVNKPDGSALKESFVVTTYNDNKDVTKERSFDYSNLTAYSNVKVPELWRNMINTIPDMVAYLEARNYTYDGREPDFCAIDDWQWTASGYSIATYNGGVCVQVAQCADYMLTGNFENWGNIIIFGKQGHIFNWFYEDGYYYVFDFTSVITDNLDHYYEPRYRDFSIDIKKFSNVEKIKTWIQSGEKLDCSQNPLVVMYSCQGHDYMPTWLDVGMHSYDEIYKYPNRNWEWGFEDVVVNDEDFTVLWQ